jgi:hypothetical protein
VLCLQDPSHGEKNVVSVARHSGASTVPGEAGGAKKLLWAAHRPIPDEQDPDFDDFDGNKIDWATARAIFDYDQSNVAKVYPKVDSVVVAPTTLEAMRMSMARGFINRDTLSMLSAMRNKGASHAKCSRTFE